MGQQKMKAMPSLERWAKPFRFSELIKGDLFEMTKNLELFTNIFRELEAHYVDEISPDKLVTTGIDAMLNSLDPYTNFIPEEDLSSYKLQTTGKLSALVDVDLCNDTIIMKRDGL